MAETSSSHAPGTARAALILLLQRAHAGELAAARAYQGHAASWWARRERVEIQAIEADEWRHRADVGKMLSQLGAGPDPGRETRMWLIGSTIGLLCHPGGWLIPMLGAGMLERDNVHEYETAARLALQSDCPDMIACLLEMAEKEWDHQLWFMQKVQSHWLTRRLPWLRAQAEVKGTRAGIRRQFEQFQSQAVTSG